MKNRTLVSLGLLMVMLMSITIAEACGQQRECELNVVDFVDIGNLKSEEEHRMFGWGSIEPTTSGGNWGGIEDARAVSTKETRDIATIILDSKRCFGKKELVINALDGLADDSFVVFVNGIKVYKYEDEQNEEEIWKEHTITLNRLRYSSRLIITIKLLGEHWSGYDAYGQLGIDSIALKCLGFCYPRFY